MPLILFISTSCPSVMQNRSSSFALSLPCLKSLVTLLGLSGRMHSFLTASSASLCSSPRCHDNLPSFDPTLTASFSPETTRLVPASVFHHLVLFGSHISPLGFPGGGIGKEPACECKRDMGSIPGLGRSAGGENDNLFQYSCLENPMDRGASGLQSIGSYSWT